MKPDDVTNAMIERFKIDTDFFTADESRQIIASAVNAVLPQDDNEPVTAEWLLRCDYRDISEDGMDFLFTTDEGEDLTVSFRMKDGALFFAGYPTAIARSVENRGQLRGWHKAFGQELKEVQS